MPPPGARQSSLDLETTDGKFDSQPSESIPVSDRTDPAGHGPRRRRGRGPRPEAGGIGEVGKAVIGLIKTLAAPLMLFAVLDAFLRTTVRARAAC